MFNDRNLASKILSFVLSLLLLSRSLTWSVGAEELVISGNGQGSDNEVTITSQNNQNINQSNDASVENDINLDSNTGENTASSNTGGDVSVDTGNSSTQLNVENNVNSSYVSTECCLQENTVEVKNNGSESINKVNVVADSSTSIDINQTAYISNNISGSTNTGGNSANSNNGNTSITTGNIGVSGEIVNGGINIYSVSAPKDLISSRLNISGNGDESRNIINIVLKNNNFVSANNNADIFNSMFWDLNTGGNRANSNNGNVNIVTGDILFDFFIKNGPINVGGVWLPCCIFDPAEEDNEEPDDQEEENGEDEQNGEDEENGEDKEEAKDEDGDENGVGGVILAAPATSEILGLSDTSSEAAQNLFFWVGVIMIALGVNFIGKELLNEKHFETASQ